MSFQDIYNSGGDFELSDGEQSMTFGERDFRERVEYAARKLKLVEAALTSDELDDLVSMVTDDEHVTESKSPLADHIHAHYDAFFPDSGNEQPVLTDWLKRLVFRRAWFDQRVLSGEFDVDFDPETGDFNYVHDDQDRLMVETATPSAAPSWKRVAYHPPA